MTTATTKKENYTIATNENLRTNNSYGTYRIVQIKDIIRDGRFRQDFGDIKELAENIETVGLLHVPTLDQNNVLIAGARRIRALEYLGRTEILCYILNTDQIVLGEFSENSMRKDWTISELVAYKKYLEPKFKNEARQRQLAGRPCVNLTQGRTMDHISKILHKSRNTLKEAEEVIDSAKIEPDKYQSLVDKMDSNQWSVNKTYKKFNKIRRREYLKSLKPTGELPVVDKCKLLQGDFFELIKQIPDNSVNLLITDPPYAEQYLYLYERMTKEATRVLKPGGILASYAGQIMKNKVYRTFDDSGLNYHWEFTIKHEGPGQLIPARNIIAESKPIIVYHKGEKINEMVMLKGPIGDFIQSSKPDKYLHEWEQSEVESLKIIEHYSEENDTVLDVMMGSGTNGVAALKLNRKFIGIEIDPDTFETAKNRIMNETK